MRWQPCPCQPGRASTRSPQRAGGSRTGKERSTQRQGQRPQSTHRANPEQGQGSVAASSPQTRAVRRVCPQCPRRQADGWIPTCAGAVGGTGAGSTQPSSSAPALPVLSSQGDRCPFPGRTVAHVAPRVSSHPGDDPDSKAFPSPAGAGSGPAPSQEVPEPVPGPSLAAPRVPPALGDQAQGATAGHCLPCPAGTQPRRLRVERPRECSREGAVRDSSQPRWAPGGQPGSAATSRPLWLLRREQPSHRGQGNMYKQQRGGAHRPVWRLKVNNLLPGTGATEQPARPSLAAAALTRSGALPVGA